MSITCRAEIETDYTDGSSNGGNNGGKPDGGDDGKGDFTISVTGRNNHLTKSPTLWESLRKATD